MRSSHLANVIVPALLLSCAGCPGPFLRDIAPNSPVSGSIRSSGLILRLAGGDDILYAISLDAGVWRRMPGEPWKQLGGSPRQAFTIAVEARNHRHVIVGERNGNSASVQLNQAGVWESNDAGFSWSYVFDPLTIQGCRTQAIADVAFTAQSHLVAATACGLAHRTPAGVWSFPDMQGASGPPTALAVAGTRVWARTAIGQLFVSTDDGATFTAAPIDPTTPLPASLLDMGAFGDWRGAASYSLAALHDEVYMPARNLPGAGDNELGLVTYDAVTTKVRSDLLGVGDGRGLGGWSFVRAGTMISNIDVILFSNAQGLFRLTKDTHTTGPWKWKLSVLASCDSTKDCADPPSGRRPRVHTDEWDVLINTNSVYGEAWLSGDGGIYHSGGEGWEDYNDGLHTLHAHTLEVLLGSPGTVATSTSDNDVWYGTTTGTNWRSPSCCGDGNATASDAANPAWVLFVRNGIDADLTRVDGGGGSFADIAITTSPLYWFQFVQTMTGEVKAVDLDAVMLVSRPLKNQDGSLVGGKLAAIATGTGPALIRNRQFQKQPNVKSGWGDWTVEATDLPVGTYRFWVTNGHASTYYYVLAQEPDASGVVRFVLYRRKDVTGWEKLIDDIPNIGAGSPYGPVYVNPYYAGEVWAIRDDGVWSSTDAGTKFTKDDVLTALVTQSARYKLTNAVADDATYDAQSNLYYSGRGFSQNALADLRFARSNPKVRVAAGATTGVFFDGGDQIWRDLTPVLPKPLAPISGVATDGDAVYVSMEGRSVVRIDKPLDAKPASYFVVDPKAPGGVVAKLMRADGKAIGGVQVKVTVIDASARAQFPYEETTGPAGEIGLPVPVDAAARGAVYIDFAGDDKSAPAQTRFVMPAPCTRPPLCP